MKTMSGFSSGTLESKDKGKADSALPLSGFEVAEGDNEREICNKQVKQLDAFGGIAQTSEDEHVAVNTFDTVVGKQEEKSSAGPGQKTFFERVRFEEDNFEEDENEEPAEVVDTKQVESSEEVSTAEDATPVSESEIKEPVSVPVTETVKKETPPPVQTTTLKSNIMDKVDSINEHPLSFLAKCCGVIYSAMAKVAKRVSFNKLIHNGVRVQSGDFEFVKVSNYLILIKYSGVDNIVKIPAIVGNLPVLYVHPDFLYSGVNPFDNYKIRSLVTAVKGLSTNALEEDSENKFISDITEVQLPNTLIAISDGAFDGCLGLKELVIPASVKAFNFGAIKNSGITSLYFNGSIPKGFDQKKFHGDIYIKEDSDEGYSQR